MKMMCRCGVDDKTSMLCVVLAGWLWLVWWFALANTNLLLHVEEVSFLFEIFD